VEKTKEISDKLLAKHSSTGVESRKEGEEIKGKTKAIKHL
jgi:hypothetical protein